MTIKEVEQRLEVPRATVRFYEKEGLLAPTRGENGYREYSEEDVILLKKIIILRKLGITVAEIEDLLDGVKSMEEVLETNVANLEQQMAELKGAMMLCRKMQENKEQIETFDAEKYWNVVEEEERKGNRFLDIAKDVAKFEKATIFEFFSIADRDGNFAASSIPYAVGQIVVSLFLTGCIICLIEGSWSFANFGKAISGMLTILLVEVIIGVPVYFITKKYPNLQKKRSKILFACCLLLAVVLLILASIFE